ncbi:CehA/McbA family metallohydrolase [Pseudonocardia lacus]|uniref:CehA/McbA family metallohydrolase n=1 Tax=Pseudonocardia lacus TaxID=2835865 RepID=UPI001BDC2815|nr:CehA/McbA family metallohydrolase [Pseudonocardia lacus]
MPDWFRGDCHVHTARSNSATLTVEEVVHAARQSGLDFIATTEHNTVDGHADWAPYTSELVVILGQEVTTRTGHWLALGLELGRPIDWRYGVPDGRLEAEVDQVRAAAGLCVAAHPHAPYACGQLGYPFELFDAVEVWNGRWTSDLPWQADNETALAERGRGLAAGVAAGRWLPAVGNSDAHLPGQLGAPQTVVLADELTPTAVLAGLRAGRSWIAASRDVELTLTVSADARVASIGDVLLAEDVVVEASVRGVASGRVSFHTERGRTHAATLPPSGTGEVIWEARASDAGFVRVEVRDRDGAMAALTNPVQLTSSAGQRRDRWN